MEGYFLFVRLYTVHSSKIEQQNRAPGPHHERQATDEERKKAIKRAHSHLRLVHVFPLQVQPHLHVRCSRASESLRFKTSPKMKKWPTAAIARTTKTERAKNINTATQKNARQAKSKGSGGAGRGRGGWLLMCCSSLQDNREITAAGRRGVASIKVYRNNYGTRSISSERPKKKHFTFLQHDF